MRSTQFVNYNAQLVCIRTPCEQLNLNAVLAEKEDPIDAETVIEALLATRATPAAVKTHD